MKTFLSCIHGPKFTYCRLHRLDIGSHLDARLKKRILFFSCLSTCRLNFQIQTTRGSVRCSSLEPYTLPDPLWALPMRDTLMSLLFFHLPSMIYIQRCGFQHRRLSLIWYGCWWQYDTAAAIIKRLPENCLPLVLGMLLLYYLLTSTARASSDISFHFIKLNSEPPAGVLFTAP